MKSGPLAGWSEAQKKVVVASFLGWTLDAFDFFLLVFVLKDIAHDFGTEIAGVTVAILLTLAMAVQGAWGVIPAHLNELSPANARATFPGFVYQLGNLLASANATIQAGLAVQFGGDYGLALALVAGVVAVVIAVLTGVGVEAKGVSFDAPRESQAA
jgi:hypothetical protein